MVKEFIILFRLKVLGWPKSLFRFFHTVLPENLYGLFANPIFAYMKKL